MQFPSKKEKKQCFNTKNIDYSLEMHYMAELSSTLTVNKSKYCEYLSCS